MRPLPRLTSGLVVYALWCATGAAYASNTSTLSVCVDRASATAARDRAVAQNAATREGMGLRVFGFDSSDDDEGLGARAFLALLAQHCDLILGYPVDQTGGEPPPGLAVTRAYDQTGFVLATAAPLSPASLAGLPQDSEVAVTYGAVPNLYFVSHRNVQADIELTEAATLQALVAGKVRAAMVWQPTITDYLAAHARAQFGFATLAEPHARYDIVALYTASGAKAAAMFEAGLAPAGKSGDASGALPGSVAPPPRPFVHRAAAVSGGPADPAPPALYTAAQAHAGEQKFGDDCAPCHGADLEGQAAPALKGKLFASVKTGFTVGDILNFMAVNMPATQPGSLERDDYTDIMAFVLARNGYPAGDAKLTFDAGTQSKVPLLYYGK